MTARTIGAVVWAFGATGAMLAIGSSDVTTHTLLVGVCFLLSLIAGALFYWLPGRPR